MHIKSETSPFRGIESIILYISAFFVIFINAGLWRYDQTIDTDFPRQYSEFRLILFIGVVVLLLIYRRISLPKNSYLFLAPLVYLLFSEGNSGRLSFLDYFLLPLLCITIICSFDDNKHRIWKAFTNLTMVLALVSLLFYLSGTLLHIVPPMTYINRGWGTWDPKPIANYYYLYYEAQVTHRATFDVWRNCGIFAEATMYSSILCTALAAETFLYNRGGFRFFVIPLLVVTIITTFSATGLVFLVFWGMLVVLSWKKTQSFIAHHRILFFISLGILLVGIVGILAAKLSTSAGSGSASVRLDHTLTCFRLWLRKPLIGYGWDQQQAFMDAAHFSQGTSVGIPMYLYFGGIVLGSLVLVPYLGSLIYGIKARKLNLFFFNSLFLLVFFFTALTIYPIVQLFIASNLYLLPTNSTGHEKRRIKPRLCVRITAGLLILALAGGYSVCAIKLKHSYSITQIAPVQSSVCIEDPYIYDINELELNADFRSPYWLSIRGWFIEEGADSTNHKLNVILVDQNSGESYRIPTTTAIRRDVTNSFDDGSDYDQSGFIVTALMDDLFAGDYYDYDLYFEVQYAGQTIYFDPDIDLTCVFDDE